MRVISRANNAMGAAKRWYNTYHSGSHLGWRFGDDKRVIYENLVALGSDPDPDDVNRVIGNTSWTDCRCSECKSKVGFVVMVGEEPDYESETAYLCQSCITKLWSMVG